VIVIKGVVSLINKFAEQRDKRIYLGNGIIIPPNTLSSEEILKIVTLLATVLNRVDGPDKTKVILVGNSYFLTGEGRQEYSNADQNIERLQKIFRQCFFGIPNDHKHLIQSMKKLRRKFCWS
jgi:hypothetical protein